VDFIKRHYEKVILLGLFVIFIGLMFLVQSVISSTQEVKESDLKLPPRSPDFQNEDPKDDKFDTDKRWNNSNFIWKTPEIADKSEPVSDMVSAYKMTACPFCSKSGGKQVLIPLSSFYIADEALRKCPECGHKLATPLGIDVIAEEMRFHAIDEEKAHFAEECKFLEAEADTLRQENAEEARAMEEIANELYRIENERLAKIAEERRREEEKDKDNDGILDELEEKYGMSSNDENDIFYDNDGDGFANAFELENGTVPNDPLSHPELWWRLQVKSISKIPLQEKFMALLDNGSDDMSAWQLQFNYFDQRRNRTVSRYLSVGQTIMIDNKNYRLTDVKRIVTEKKRVAGNLDNKETVDRIDESRATLVEVTDKKPDKLTFVVNQTAYSNDMRPILVDTGNLGKQKNRPLRIGDTFRMGLFSVKDGDNNSGGGATAKERRKHVRLYKVVSVDEKKFTVQLEDVTPQEKSTAKNGKKSDEGKSEVQSAAAKEPIIITKEGKVPANRRPKKKVQKTEGEQDEGLRITTDGNPRNGR